jgi:hypothetical protein
MVWLDRFRVLGNFHGSEAVNKVIIFDGKTGKTDDVLTNHGADGYQLLKAYSRQALVAKMRDSGGPAHSGRRRLISCLQLDLGSLKAVPAACPQGTTLPEEPGQSCRRLTISRNEVVDSELDQIRKTIPDGLPMAV